MVRVQEPNIGKAVLDILASQPNGRATVATIKKELPKHVTLSSSDQKGSITRTNEELWEQQVRNLRSHKNTPGNIFAEGYVRWVSRGVWELTDAGRAKISS